MTEYRIDDLAREAGTSVRNVRYYQDNRMLPAPRRQGRIALYSDAHLARLRLITRLLDRGYTTAHITELVTAWEQGRDLADVLGLERVLSGSMSAEIPTYLAADEVCALFGSAETTSALIDKVVHAGLAAPEDGRYRLASPRAVHAVAELVKIGAPLGAALELGGQLLRSIDETVRGLVTATAEHLLRDRDRDWIPAGDEISELTTLIQQIRPLAHTALTAAFNLSLDTHLDEVLGDYVARIMPHLKHPRTA